MLSTPVGRVRAAGLLEGVSALLLFFVAMPLKYLSDVPDLGTRAVFYVGAVHGGLFVLYALVALVAWGQKALTFRLVAYAALASVIPAGPFVIDRVLKRHEQRAAPDTPPARR
ncbi:MAG: DUF3817 domain-containing protein [Gemmata sp.]